MMINDLLRGAIRLLLRGVLFCVLLVPSLSSAQDSVSKEKPVRILFLLDASVSMLQPWQGGENRFQAASRIMLTVMDSVYAVNPGVAFALRVFGEQSFEKEQNCFDTRLEVPFSFQNREQMRTRLNWLRPKGGSPVAYALKKSAETDLPNYQKYNYSIILLTDGEEGCGGDVCGIYDQFLDKKIGFKPYIFSLLDQASLKQAYACFGKVLPVADPQQTAPAITTFVRDNYDRLKVRNIAYKPVPLKEYDSGGTYNLPDLPTPKKLPETHWTTPQPKKPVPPSPPIKEEPKDVEIVHQIPVTPPQPIEKPNPPRVDLPKTPTMKRVETTKMVRRYNLLFALPSPRPIQIVGVNKMLAAPYQEPASTANPAGTPPVATTPREAPQPPAEGYNNPVTKPSPKVTYTRENPVATVPKPETKALDFYVTADEAAGPTQLEIYFTDGKGRFYSTEPLINILDSRTGSKVKQTYRTILGGKPEPIAMNAGTYDIVIPGSESKASNISIQPNKTNKVYIRAISGSLAFYYTTDPKRPVKEFVALVSDRFGSRKVITQKCDEILTYEPANYHIEINTLPKLVYNIDLNFGEFNKVSIPTPGTFQVSNRYPIGEVDLYYQSGTHYVPFVTMQINGNPEAQKVAILPGSYQVRYFKQPKKPYDKPVVIPFRVQSEQTTSVTLEK